MVSRTSCVENTTEPNRRSVGSKTRSLSVFSDVIGACGGNGKRHVWSEVWIHEVQRLFHQFFGPWFCKRRPPSLVLICRHVNLQLWRVIDPFSSFMIRDVQLPVGDRATCVLYLKTERERAEEVDDGSFSWETSFLPAVYRCCTTRSHNPPPTLHSLWPLHLYTNCQQQLLQH